MKVIDIKTLNKYKFVVYNDCDTTNSRISKGLIDPNYDLYREAYFKELLCTERKRTERSKKPFLLLRLNIEKILEGVNSAEVLKDMLSVLFLSTRETDLHGWYRHNAEIGIIFTEIDAPDIHAAVQAIGVKMRANLLRHLPHDMVRGIVMHFHLFPEQTDIQLKTNVLDPTFYPDMVGSQSPQKIIAVIKRLMDIIGGLAGMIIFSPFFLTIPVLIRLTSKGPVFFRQERIGVSGTKFIFLKFRTMYVNNDDSIHREYMRKLITGKIDAKSESGQAGNAPVYKIRHDPRVTPLGRFMRKTSLDEIPQFINVLKGEMSLVGPRPAIPYEYESYDTWHRHRLLQVKPGITGLWQVKGRSSTSFDEMVRLDLKYIREWSLWLDIKLLFLTPLAVFRGKGAY